MFREGESENLLPDDMTDCGSDCRTIERGLDVVGIETDDRLATLEVTGKQRERISWVVVDAPMSHVGSVSHVRLVVKCVECR